MTTTAHAITGIFIATIIHRPKLAIPLAFLSHFFCDTLPHFGIGMEFGSIAMFTWLIIDGLALLGLLLFLRYKKINNVPLLAVAGFAAMSPDLAWFYYGMQGTLSDISTFDPLSRLHSTVQWFEHPLGIVIDVAWICLLGWLIMRNANYESHKDPATSRA
jgi:hypothetical protein